MQHLPLYALLVVAALIAGAQNALAGGGSFITFPALLLFGMGARAANITSTIALFPGQVATGFPTATATTVGTKLYVAYNGGVISTVTF